MEDRRLQSTEGRGLTRKIRKGISKLQCCTNVGVLGHNGYGLSTITNYDTGTASSRWLHVSSFGSCTYTKQLFLLHLATQLELEVEAQLFIVPAR